MESWYLWHFRIDRHQKVVQEREVKLASLVALLQQPPTVSKNVSSHDIQYIRDTLDDRIELMVESLDKIEHAIEKKSYT